MRKLVNKYPNGYADFEDKSGLEKELTGLDIKKMEQENMNAHRSNAQPDLNGHDAPLESNPSVSQPQVVV
jgi:hypothetical protein